MTTTLVPTTIQSIQISLGLKACLVALRLPASFLPSLPLSYSNLHSGHSPSLSTVTRLARLGTAKEGQASSWLFLTSPSQFNFAPVLDITL
jgi:hypothetical protein